MKEIIAYKQLCDLVERDVVDRAHADRCLMPNSEVVDISIQRVGVRRMAKPQVDFVRLPAH